MGVVLPGEPDAAVQLHGVLRTPDEAVEREGDGHGGGQGSRGGVRGRARRVPCGPPRLLGGDEHVREPVLHRLELADRPAELLAHLRVGRRGVEAPTRAACALRRHHHRGQHARPLEGDPAQHARRMAPDPHGSHAPGRVEARQRRDVDVTGHDVEHTPAVVDANEHHAGERGAEHRRVGVERDRGGRGAVEQSREQRPVVGLDDDRRRQRGGQEGSGRGGAAQLLEHDRELEQPVTLTTVLLGHVQAQPALLRQLRPERWQRLRVGVEQRARHARRTARLQPSPRGLAQRLVLLGDADRHGCVSS